MAAAAFAYRSKQNSSSDSESDDSDNECRDWKRATRRTKEEVIKEKIPIEAPPVETPIYPSPEDKPTTSKRKRNNIWCEVLEDQIISETLNHCGIKQKPKDFGNRGEESYDYTLGYKYFKKDEDSKMSEDEMPDSTETSSVTSYKDRQFHKGKFVKLDSTELAAARKIIKTLAEQKIYLIYRVVKYVGIEKAMKILKMTEEIEENGGMMIKNQVRRRTPGGVYLQLLKAEKDIEKSVIDKVFEGEMNSYEAKKLYQEKKKNKKKFLAEKKAMLKQSSKDIVFPQPEAKPETVKMEADSMVIEEETPLVKNIPPNNGDFKGSDLEDGEIED